jgi:hypothetical protein
MCRALVSIVTGGFALRDDWGGKSTCDQDGTDKSLKGYHSGEY